MDVFVTCPLDFILVSFGWFSNSTSIHTCCHANDVMVRRVQIKNLMSSFLASVFPPQLYFSASYFGLPMLFVLPSINLDDVHCLPVRASTFMK